MPAICRYIAHHACNIGLKCVLSELEKQANFDDANILGLPEK